MRHTENLGNRNHAVKAQDPGPAHGDSYLERILSIIEALAARSPAAVGELAADLGLQKSAVSRILSALALRGYAVPAGGRGQYRIGPRVVLLAGPYLQRDPLIAEAQPLLRDLAFAARASAHLGVIVDGQMVIVAKEPSPEPIQVTTRVGERIAPHAFALGKVLLAGLPEPQRARFLELPLRRFTAKTLVVPAKLAAALAEVRRKGYALEAGEEIPGVGCIGAPVTDAAGRWIAALSISGPMHGTPFRLDTAHRKLIVDKAKELSRKIAGHYSASESTMTP